MEKGPLSEAPFTALPAERVGGDPGLGEGGRTPTPDGTGT